MRSYKKELKRVISLISSLQTEEIAQLLIGEKYKSYQQGYEDANDTILLVDDGAASKGLIPEKTDRVKETIYNEYYDF